MMTDHWTSEKISMSKQFGKPMLAVEHLASKDGIVKDVKFTVRAGEILGVFGLGGSGRTETLECIYGLRPTINGSVTLDDRNWNTSPQALQFKAGWYLFARTGAVWRLWVH
jgi:ribose transport system ATP-binding protein